MIELDPVVAAGAVVMRRRKGVGQVLLVHRPKYDDWAFPKGKLDPGEGARTAAVREVLEETGARIRLGPVLSDQTYAIGNGTPRTKLVHYWTARVRGDYRPADYAVNEEIDAVDWFDLDAARKRLSYDRDRDVLREALAFQRRSHPLVVLRHAQATPRKQWSGDETERPLTPLGKQQAQALVPHLAAYGVKRLVSSSARRCWTTLAPYGSAYDREIEVTDHLSEAGAHPDRISDEVEWLLGLETAAVLCSHRPVLPAIFDAIGIDEPPLEPAAAVVVHHRHGRVVAVERLQRYRPPKAS
jgi:8-oxo-dGTP pyrophosphatase MutT (NUDIX family)/phosphohistidine phosphatase SixA